MNEIEQLKAQLAQVTAERDAALQAIHALQQHSLLCPRCCEPFHESDVTESPEKFWRCPYCRTHQHAACRVPMDPDHEALEIIAERDSLESAIQSIHVVLGGDGEWSSGQDLCIACQDMVKQLVNERDAALAKCAEMRDALISLCQHHEYVTGIKIASEGGQIKHALSSDCGEGYHSPQEWDALETKWKSASMCELAGENPNLKLYMEHWENRAMKAEAKCEQMRKLIEELRGFVPCSLGTTELLDQIHVVLSDYPAPPVISASELEPTIKLLSRLVNRLPLDGMEITAEACEDELTRLTALREKGPTK